MNNVKQLINETKKYLTKYDYQKVIELCEEILELDPSSTFGLKFNAIAYSQNGDYHKSLEYYLLLYELSPDEDTMYEIAYSYEQLGNYNKALEYYDRDSTSSWVQSKRKHLLTKLKSFQELDDTLNDKLSELEKQDNSEDTTWKKIFILEEKAVYQYRNRNYKGSIDSLRNASTLYNTIKSNSYYKDKYITWYTMLQEYLEQYDNPIDFFNKFFTYNEKIWNKKLKYGLYYVSIAYHMLFLELEPHNKDLLNVCARRFKSFDYDYSLECWYKILEIEPENIEAIKEILDIYSKQYSKDRALKLIDEKSYITSIRPKLLEHKIRLLESMTLYDGANNCYDEYSIYRCNALFVFFENNFYS